MVRSLLEWELSSRFSGFLNYICDIIYITDKSIWHYSAHLILLIGYPCILLCSIFAFLHFIGRDWLLVSEQFNESKLATRMSYCK
jgi:hypothetical protein